MGEGEPCVCCGKLEGVAYDWKTTRTRGKRWTRLVASELVDYQKENAAEKDGKHNEIRTRMVTLPPLVHHPLQRDISGSRS